MYFIQQESSKQLSYSLKVPSNPSFTFIGQIARRSLVGVLNALNPDVRTRDVLSHLRELGPFETGALLKGPKSLHVG